MSFSNQEYLYQNLPSRFRRDDENLFLKRFLRFFGETADEWDEKFDLFFENIEPDTAEVLWIELWLDILFGWSWFPWWFTTEDKRTLYRNFARHLARRGTRRGIELWLWDFGIIARVHTRLYPYGEFVWGETNYIAADPLRVLIEIVGLRPKPFDVHAWGEAVYGEFHYADPRPLLTEREILDLIRYIQPHAQDVLVTWRTLERERPTTIYHWEEIEW